MQRLWFRIRDLAEPKETIRILPIAETEGISHQRAKQLVRTWDNDELLWKKQGDVTAVLTDKGEATKWVDPPKLTEDQRYRDIRYGKVEILHVDDKTVWYHLTDKDRIHTTSKQRAWSFLVEGYEWSNGPRWQK